MYEDQASVPHKIVKENKALKSSIKELKKNAEGNQATIWKMQKKNRGLCVEPNSMKERLMQEAKTCKNLRKVMQTEIEMSTDELNEKTVLLEMSKEAMQEMCSDLWLYDLPSTTTFSLIDTLKQGPDLPQQVARVCHHLRSLDGIGIAEDPLPEL